MAGDPRNMMTKAALMLAMLAIGTTWAAPQTVITTGYVDSVDIEFVI